MKRGIVCCILICSAVILQAQTKDEKAIQKILDDQVFYWNKGDLDNFVKGYWNNDSLMFIGSKAVVYGYDNTLARYKKNYSDTAQMGKLRFTIMHTKKPSPKYYWVVGRFDLKRSVGYLSGHFNLLLQKIQGEWKIIADHSS